MPHHRPRTALHTHEVFNQPPPFNGVNLYDADHALKNAVMKNGGGTHETALRNFGAACGAAETAEWSRQANANSPTLQSFDRYGRRLDEVSFHPAYHALMRMGFEAGVSSSAWTAKKAGHVLHSALLYLMSGVDGGVCCPMSMSYAAVAALRHDAAFSDPWLEKLTRPAYDPRVLPAAEKSAVTMGMAMTEKQGGSDIRANETRAHPQGGNEYELTGHKWFCSAPMSDGFLTLAQTNDGLTCFLAPRWRPDGARNAIHLMRLKNKMGDRSNASAEIEYHGAYAKRLGAVGDGVKTIIEMVQHTRLDCVVGSAGGMRAALAEALWHAGHRSAFQKKLIDQPAMQLVLADLALEAEAASALAFRIARSFDAAADDAHEAAIMRLATPIAKYWVCKRQPGFVYEALECLGGAGFIEDSPMPRLYRGAPLNAIWEGSGNVIALDILRAAARAPETLEAVRTEIKRAAGANRHFDAHLSAIEKWAAPGMLIPAKARAFAEDLALALQAATLFRTAPDFVFDGFCSARLDRDQKTLAYGALPDGVDASAIVDRASPIAGA